MVIDKIECNLPWSNFKVEKFPMCKTMNDFEKYFEALSALQKQFSAVPKKCAYTVWNPTHYDDDASENKTELDINLILMNNQVNILISF